MAVDANVGNWGCQRLESPRRIAKWGDEAPNWRSSERSVGVSYLLGKRVEEQRLFEARRYLVCESEGPPERTGMSIRADRGMIRSCFEHKYVDLEVGFLFLHTARFWKPWRRKDFLVSIPSFPYAVISKLKFFFYRGYLFSKMQLLIIRGKCSIKHATGKIFNSLH
ncbi:hypothetical protein TNCT_260271 [Trichonephila clavata]|uniref:Uncharacterized protein n=1 Tax=Trichonephila clavata TaxID=2740835 RepID=A0A8X6HL59_TRICU|nr:hypothetical protein TNCT_260271 [Trichonephila clavata]